MRWNWDHPTTSCRWEPPWTSASSWRCSSAPSPVSSASVWSLSGSSLSSLTPTPRSPGDHLCDVQAEPQASEANRLESVFLRTGLPETSIYLKPVSGAICLEILRKQFFAENDFHSRSSRYVVPPSPRPVKPQYQHNFHHHSVPPTHCIHHYHWSSFQRCDPHSGVWQPRPSSKSLDRDSILRWQWWWW